ncbi:MAG: LOG family protein [Gammaproteobacteria bacterium]|nr:LOG family protein [Gammaproteobacteria bacterium]MBT6701658.1 LOG family protein [Gammaproteobacteria bacterium]MBT7208280.1 LOG family protein [Gammaproteobacteria bacterium]
MKFEVIDAIISPHRQLETLSQLEVSRILKTSKGELSHIFRNCSLAVLNCGSALDDGNELLDRYPDFSIKVLQKQRGIKLSLKNAPAIAFVDGKLIAGINEHLFAVLRDVIYVDSKIVNSSRFNLNKSDDVSNAVFHILRNAQLFIPGLEPNLVVCWGGHSISPKEYNYTKEVGYQMGLRNLDICTGCGPGAMKGPMKGATIGHAKQRSGVGRYLGLTEPGIIAAESPNPIVNKLVIMPDIEKRLEAFVRTGHGIVVFPGGAGTAEEILYLLGILLHPDNSAMPFPLIFTGPKSAEDYFKQINRFILDTLGPEAQQRYKIIIDDPARVAIEMKADIKKVRKFRKEKSDAYYYNWSLTIDEQFQKPFDPTHDNMRNLDLTRDQKSHHLAANLRRAFSGVVSGNVKEDGIKSIKKHGLFELKGDVEIMRPMDALLSAFVKQQRMKLPGTEYKPCYRIIK